MNGCNILVSLIILSTVTCQHKGDLKRQSQSGLFTYFSTDNDRSTVREIEALMDSVAHQIPLDLDVDYRHPVTVEIYPSQEEYDAHLMNPTMRGSPAVSGKYRIQMVSPRAPIRVPGITYNNRLWFAVHEFVHLVIDQISQQTPMWLDEGVASYEGSGSFYARDERVRKILGNQLPSLAKLMQSYSELPAADVYSFSVVEFIVSEYGMPALVRVLRSPENLEQVLNAPLGALEEKWHQFAARRYRPSSQ